MSSMNRIAIKGFLVVISAVPPVAAQGNVENPKPGASFRFPNASQEPAATNGLQAPRVFQRRVLLTARLDGDSDTLRFSINIGNRHRPEGN